MQDLLIIKNGRVTVQMGGDLYDDTFANFLLDGGGSLPDGVESLDYNKTVENCWLNGVAFQGFPNEYAEGVLASIKTLVENKAKREQEAREQAEAERLANMTQEEIEAQALAQAKAERAEAVSKITVDVDGMTFDGDETSQTRMGRTIAAAIALGVDLNTYKQVWVLADNTVAEVTVSQLAQALKLACEAQTALWTVPYSAEG